MVFRHGELLANTSINVISLSVGCWVEVFFLVMADVGVFSVH